MFNWFKYLVVLPKLVGLVKEVLGLVNHAEDIVAGGDKGAAKKALVLAVIDQTVDVAAALGIPEARGIDRAKLQGVVSTIIDSLVGVLNSLGIFKHTPNLPAT